MPDKFSALLSSPEQWLLIRKKLDEQTDRFNELIAMAESAFSSPGYTVTDKKNPPPGGTLNDYTSLSKYYWPNPDTPDHLPWIGKDGLRNPAADDYDAPRVLDFCLAVSSLAGAAKLTGETKYAIKAGTLLRRWFLDPATKMNPHMNYAQFSPGNFSGSCVGVIDAHFFCELIEAIRVLEFNENWTETDLQNLKVWFKEFQTWLCTAPLPLEEATMRNNHGTWYDLQLVSVSLFIGDTDRAIRQIRECSFARLDGQLNENAEMPQELRRTLSLTYTYFNLLGWSWLAALAKTQGIELWKHRNIHGISLHDAFKKVLPSFLGQEEWKHQQIGPCPRAIEYCRLFAVVNLVDEIPEIRDFLKTGTENPIWQIASFMTNDDWQQAPRKS